MPRSFERTSTRTLWDRLTPLLRALGFAAVPAVVACLATLAQEEGAQSIPDDAEYAKSIICGMCHKEERTIYDETTHGKYEPPEDAEEPWRHSTGWNRETGEAAESGVSCEACHGRGSAHVKAATKEEVDETALTINSLKLETNEQRVSICAQCHARYTVPDGEPPAEYTPGENLLAKVTLLPPEEGQDRQEVNEFVLSKHYAENGMGCIQCHTSHSEGIEEGQLRKPLNDLCAPCHHEESDIATHTDGEAQEGDTCATCHMLGGSHAFQKPPAEE